MERNKDLVLIVGNSDVGFYKFRKELLPELQRDGKQIVVVFPEGPFRKKLEDLGCNYISIPINRRGTNVFQELLLFFRYYKVVKQVKPEVALTYTIKPNIYVNLICQHFRIPVASNITGLGSAVENAGPLRSLTVFLYRLALRRTKCVFFQNRENLEFFQERKICSCRKELIPGSGVNLKEFVSLPYPTGTGAEFLFVGRIMREKGIEQFLDVAEAIKARHPETQFTIIGTLEEQVYKERIGKLEEQGIVRFEGAQEDVHPFLRRCSCVLHPTYYPEGMSNVLLEAAASGRPVITTGRSGCGEIVDDGRTGFIARERDSQDFIEKVEAFLKLSTEQRAEMGRLGREKVAREFDRQLVMDRYREVVAEMTKEGRSQL